MLPTLFSAAFLAAAASAQNATVTVLHGVPGLPAAVEVFANGNSLFTFDYGEQRGPLSLPPASYLLEVRLNGATILSTNASVVAGTDYSVIAHLDAAGTPTLAAFVNPLGNLTLPGSRLYVRHTAQAPAVDVLLEQGGSVVATIPNLANGQEVVADVPAGKYEVRLNAAGTSVTAFGPVGVALENGTGYAVFAVGDVQSPSFTLLQQIVPLTARVTVVHGVPGLPAPVTVAANGSALFTFDFRDVAGPLNVPPGGYTFDVLLNGSPVLTRTDTVARGDDVTVVAHLDGGGAPALSAFANDTSRVADDGARVTFRHLAVAPTVAVVDPFGVFAALPNLSNGQQGTAEIAPGNFDFSLVVAGTSTTVFGPANFRPAPNVAYQFIAVGDAGAGTLAVIALQNDLTPAIPAEIVATVGGTSCGPAISAVPSNFHYGQPFVVRATGAAPNAMGLINYGDSITSAGGVPLPLALAPFGAPGCFLNTNVIASLGVVADAAGTVEVPFLIPAACFGILPGYLQIGTMTTSNSFGFVASEYLELR